MVKMRHRRRHPATLRGSSRKGQILRKVVLFASFSSPLMNGLRNENQEKLAKVPITIFTELGIIHLVFAEKKDIRGHIG